MLCQNIFLVLLLPTFASGFAWSSQFITQATALDTHFRFKFLESNSWIWNVDDISILVDPVMDGALDFGVPALYSGKKKVIDGRSVLDNISSGIDYVLISQGFEDHSHTPTLKRLSRLRPDMNYIAPPSALPIMKACGIKNIETIVPGQTKVLSKGSTRVEITSTSGAVLGPPWQAPENGYIVRSKSTPTSTSDKSIKSIYYEPHCMYDPIEISRYSVDCVITPVISQEILSYAFVAGGSKALELAKLLKAKVVIPMNNGDLHASGLLSKLLQTRGTVQSFKDQIAASKLGIRVVDAPPGQEISL